MRLCVWTSFGGGSTGSIQFNQFNWINLTLADLLRFGSNQRGSLPDHRKARRTKKLTQRFVDPESVCDRQNPFSRWPQFDQSNETLRLSPLPK